MGWLELLPLLKRLLPLLARLSPMLEGLLVARSANGKDVEAALQRVNDDMKTELTLAGATVTEKHAALTRTLAEHTERLTELSADIQKVYLAGGRNDERMESIEAKVQALRTLILAAVVLLALCAGLLLVLLLRHNS